MALTFNLSQPNYFSHALNLKEMFFFFFTKVSAYAETSFDESDNPDCSDADYVPDQVPVI